MLLLVLGDSYLNLYVGWEGVGLASYLLIGFWNQKPTYATAAKKAFVGWSKLSGKERGKYIFRIARLIQERAREFAVMAALAIAVLWMGVYPKPFTDVMDPAVAELLRHVANSKLN